MPPLAIAAYAVEICIWVTSWPWPIGRLPIVEPEYLLDGEHEAALLAGQVDAGRRAEPEAADPVVEARGPHLQADGDRPDVGGLREDLAWSSASPARGRATRR